MYHLLAKGHIDIVVEAKFGGFYDIAAVARIVEGAGGKVTDLRGNPLTFESSSMLATNGLLHEAALEFFNNKQ